MAYSCCWCISADKEGGGGHKQCWPNCTTRGQNLGRYKTQALECIKCTLTYKKNERKIKKTAFLRARSGTLKKHLLLTTVAGITGWEAGTHPGQVTVPSQDMHSLTYQITVYFARFMTVGGNKQNPHNCPNCWNKGPYPKYPQKKSS